MSELPERNEIMKPTIEFETQPSVTLLGSLEDFGLGNKINGIPSELADASETEKLAYGERLTQALSEVNDANHYGCIDGRFCLCNADGSEPKVRLRQVSGTGSVTEIALNADVSVVRGHESDTDLVSLYDGVDRFYQDVTGVCPSAHTGGCGGLNGAVADNEAIHTKPAVMTTVEAVMNLQPVYEYTGISFDRDIASEIEARAGRTAELLQAGGWVGQDYVDKTEQENPGGVEKLQTADDEFHGHCEPAVVFILNTGETRYSLSDDLMKQYGVNPPFVVSLDASLDMARALGGDQGPTGVQKALTANIAKHVAVANRLPDAQTPVYLLVV